MTVSYAYPQATFTLVTGFTYTTSTIKCALLTGNYSPTGAEQFFSDVVANEVAGAGYTAGGVTLTTKTATYNATTKTTILDADNPDWATLTAQFRYAVFYISTGTNSTSKLLSYVDFETARTATAQYTRVIIPAAGILTVQVA